jgi:predicted DNA-binding transcriptional regulator YafY
VSVDLFSVVGEAVQRRHRLRFAYQDREGASTAREVEPYRQVYHRDRWYLLAWDVERHNWRTFRLDRVGEAQLTDRPFVPRELPADTAAAYLEAELRAPRYQASVVFHASIDEVSRRLAVRDGVLESLDSRHCRFTDWVDSFEWLAIRVAMVGVDFVVEEPPRFVEYCRTLRHRLDRAVTESSTV